MVEWRVYCELQREQSQRQGHGGESREDTTRLSWAIEEKRVGRGRKKPLPKRDDLDQVIGISKMAELYKGQQSAEWGNPDQYQLNTSSVPVLANFMSS